MLGGGFEIRPLFLLLFALLSLHEFFPQDVLQDLAARIPGQGVREDDFFRDLVAAISFLQKSMISFSSTVCPGRGTIMAVTISDQRSSGMPMTATSATLAC